LEKNVKDEMKNKEEFTKQPSRIHRSADSKSAVSRVSSPLAAATADATPTFEVGDTAGWETCRYKPRLPTT